MLSLLWQAMTKSLSDVILRLISTLCSRLPSLWSGPLPPVSSLWTWWRSTAAILSASASNRCFLCQCSDISFGLNNSAKWASDPAPLDTLATRYVGSWLAVLVDIAVLFDAVVVISAFMATTSRGLFALARHQLLPGPLASIASRFRTPVGSITLVGIVALLVTVILAITQANVAHSCSEASWQGLRGIKPTEQQGR
jgi:amino acid transporter